jgi:CysZ protein
VTSAPVPSTSSARASAVQEFLGGVGLLGRGLRMWTDSPRLMFFGAIPALIVGVVYLAAVVALAFWVDEIAAWATPFAEDWAGPVVTVFRVGVALALLAFAVFLLVRTYVALTLAIGDPFYERIWEAIETRLGGTPASDDRGFWSGVGRGLRSFVGIAAISIPLGLVLFLVGLIPGVGAPLAILVGAMLGGTVLTLELAGYAMDARDIPFRDRRRLLRRRRARSFGFGVATYLLFLVPVVAVFVMPAAVVGATVLTRELLNEPTAA